MTPKTASSEDPCIVETSQARNRARLGTVRGRNILSFFGLVHACICGKSFPPLIPVGFLPDMRKALSRRCGKSPNTTGIDCISLGTSGSSGYFTACQIGGGDVSPPRICLQLDEPTGHRHTRVRHHQQHTDSEGPGRSVV
ncbi:hypothetical protein BT67DRAFT_186295 [Trichocladium antarcticum]|uniref:Uncharacterized protein n=1 Tax=Trichocladium antarcticum TaxID=1450529 RepID=A0AAN6ZGG6_9PEZI|nr:hypothetical protein BT67DRAFT_186295 [Trichocladium antarcticum]